MNRAKISHVSNISLAGSRNLNDEVIGIALSNNGNSTVKIGFNSPAFGLDIEPGDSRTFQFDGFSLGTNVLYYGFDGAGTNSLEIITFTDAGPIPLNC